jgi:hypothetical protein
VARFDVGSQSADTIKFGFKDASHRAALVFVGARDGAAALSAKVIAAVLWITGISGSSVVRALRGGP